MWERRNEGKSEKKTKNNKIQKIEYRKQTVKEGAKNWMERERDKKERVKNKWDIEKHGMREWK